MAAVTNANEALRKMNPSVQKGKYFLASVSEENTMVLANYLEYVKGIYREKEGMSVIFSEEIIEEIKELTEKGVIGPFAIITLNVHTLFSVGFLAKITAALAKEKIAVYVSSAYYHDHLLVPYERKKDAMAALKKLTK